LDKQEFAAFLIKAAQEPRVDWYEKIDEFRCELYKLYDDINAWLKEHIDSGQIIIQADRAWFFESHREYKLPSLYITFGYKEIWVAPLGLKFGGELGHLYMQGEAATVYLSLQRSGSPWKVDDSFLGAQDEELNEETFFQIFMKICGG
jgi:hypothetical protein